MTLKEQLSITAENLGHLSYYQLLAVRPDAPTQDVRKAFQEFALRYHPDQYMGEDELTVARATLVYQRGVEAYMVLRDPVTAKAYRENLKKGKHRLSPAQRALAQRERTQTATKPKPAQPPDADAFWRQMRTKEGREVARRVEKMLDDRRFREAYLQMGLLETIEPANKAVERKADWLSRYMKKRGM